MTSYRFLMMRVKQSQIYLRLPVYRQLRLEMSKSVCTPNFDVIYLNPLPRYYYFRFVETNSRLTWILLSVSNLTYSSPLACHFVSSYQISSTLNNKRQSCDVISIFQDCNRRSCWFLCGLILDCTQSAIVSRSWFFHVFTSRDYCFILHFAGRLPIFHRHRLDCRGSNRNNCCICICICISQVLLFQHCHLKRRLRPLRSRFRQQYRFHHHHRRRQVCYLLWLSLWLTNITEKTGYVSAQFVRRCSCLLSTLLTSYFKTLLKFLVAYHLSYIAKKLQPTIM